MVVLNARHYKAHRYKHPLLYTAFFGLAVNAYSQARFESHRKVFLVAKKNRFQLQLTWQCFKAVYHFLTSKSFWQ